jgi:nitrogen regulatory protein P-II 1
MRQIKAFVRSIAVDPVIRALETAGVPGVTVSTVHGVGYGYEPEHFTLAPRDVAHAPRIAKVEVVCTARDVDRLVRVIADAARSGLAGDGIVYVAPVERAMKIRTGQEGPEALATLGRQE